MEKRDARSLTPNTQEGIRRQAIRLHKSGNKVQDVADQLEVSRKAVQAWKKVYNEGVDESAKSKETRTSGGFRAQLSEERQAKIRIIICDATPEQLKMPSALWTRDAVESLIKDFFDIKMEIRQVGRYLNRWGFTPQRSVKCAYKRNDQMVKKRMKEEYPAIAKRASVVDAEVHWGDDAGIKSNDHQGED